MASLAELKEANRQAQEQTEKEAESEEVETEEVEEEEAPEKEEIDSEDDTEESDDETDSAKEESEDWMKSDEDDSEKDTSTLPDSQAAAIRRKYKAQVKAEKEKAQTEIDELKEKIRKIDQNPNASQKSAMADKPKRDDYPTDEEWIDALTDYKSKLVQDQSQSQQIAAQRKEQQERESREVSTQVDQHYVRGAKLAEKSGIPAETYQAADMRVRTAVDAIFPEDGDVITDKLISVVGEGSERVFYNLGVNSSRLQKFESLLREDKSGLKAIAYLGTLNAQLSAPPKRTSSAPPPAEQIQGDKSSTQSERLLREQYKKARSKGDSQKAWDLRKKAKKGGADVSKW